MWYPDSATKTAQAIDEADREGLPLFILANWRGFSGGQRDLFEGILQAGSLIVEQLRKYRRPVTVYIAPGGELRGGAWVVIDTQINAGTASVSLLGSKFDATFCFAVQVNFNITDALGLQKPFFITKIRYGAGSPDLTRRYQYTKPFVARIGSLYRSLLAYDIL